MIALAQFPGSVETILDAYNTTLQEEGRLSDIFSGYIDPDAAAPTEETEAPMDLDDDDDSDDSDDEDDEEEEENSYNFV